MHSGRHWKKIRIKKFAVLRTEMAFKNCILTLVFGHTLKNSVNFKDISSSLQLLFNHLSNGCAEIITIATFLFIIVKILREKSVFSMGKGEVFYCNLLVFQCFRQKPDKDLFGVH